MLVNAECAVPAMLMCSTAAGQGVQLHRTPRLRHLEAGAVSVSLDGTEFDIALAQALSMDATHQVRVLGSHVQQCPPRCVRKNIMAYTHLHVPT